MNVILLRGLGRESRHWGDFPEKLAIALDMPSSEIMCLDFQGCGEFHNEVAPHQISVMTDHVRNQMHRLKKDEEPVLLLGISMGGMVVLDWMERFSAEVSGVVLINSSLGNQPFWWRLRPGAWGSALQSVFASPERRESIMLRQVSNDRKSYDVNEKQWLNIQATYAIRLKTVFSMLIAAATFNVAAKPSATPGIVFVSEEDRLVSVKCSQDIAHKFHWPIKLNRWAGHDLPLDDPEWLLKEISIWWKEAIPKFQIYKSNVRQSETEDCASD